MRIENLKAFCLLVGTAHPAIAIAKKNPFKALPIFIVQPYKSKSVRIKPYILPHHKSQDLCLAAPDKHICNYPPSMVEIIRIFSNPLDPLAFGYLEFIWETDVEGTSHYVDTAFLYSEPVTPCYRAFSASPGQW